MNKKLVYICSPCRGDYEQNIQKARAYCRAVVTYFPDVIPLAPHIYFTQFLDDTKQNERSLGMEAGLELLDMCDEIWVFGLDNPSEGMQAEIDYAQKNGIPVRDGMTAEKKDLTEEELGDALIALPSYSDDFGGVEVIKNTTVRISGEVVLELAKSLRRNKGHDITVEADEV